MSGLLFQHMSTGVVLVYPAIVIPAIISDLHATTDEVSWFSEYLKAISILEFGFRFLIRLTIRHFLTIQNI